MAQKEFNFVKGSEQIQVARALLDWLNQYDGFPPRVSRIEAEYLDETTSMGLFAASAPYKTQEYVDGSYTAQYQFSIQYRTAPANSNQRLNAMDVLTKIADWAEKRSDLPELGDGKIPISIERSSPAIMTTRYEDGSEDYQIMMIFNYQVKPN